jgi:integrase/single-stranded DNA-binding protein
MRTLGRLTAKAVATAKLAPGQNSRMLCDGGCLWLLIRRGEAEQTIKSWVFRFAVPTPQFKISKSGKEYRKERSMGLGSIDELPLADRPAVNPDNTPMLDRDGRQIVLPGARTLAAQARALVAAGLDPIEARKVSKSAAAANQTKPATFAAMADEYLKTNQGSWKSSDHRRQWERTLRTQINPVIGSMNVADVDTQAVLRVLQPIWPSTPETASRIRGRIRGRIEVVLNFARVKCGFTWPDGNPARWRGHLKEVFPKRNKAREVKHLPSLDYKQIGEFMAELRAKTDIAARALEAVILCGTRSGETLKAEWNEVDWENRVWNIPGAHRKRDKPLAVPLSDAALAVFHHLFDLRQGKRTFPIGKRAMDTILKAMRKDVCVHRFRATFRTWAGKQPEYAFELCELAVGQTALLKRIHSSALCIAKSGTIRSDLGGRGDVQMIECAFTGTLGRDAEVKTSGKGRQYVKLNLRVAEADDAQWVSVISFDPDAVPLAGTFVKGAKVYVEGRISMSEWTRQDGAKRTGLSAIANFSRLVQIGRHRARDESNGHRQAAARGRDDTRRSEPVYGGPVYDDEIPL